jgi:hypothetical protein
MQPGRCQACIFLGMAGKYKRVLERINFKGASVISIVRVVLNSTTQILLRCEKDFAVFF